MNSGLLKIGIVFNVVFPDKITELAVENYTYLEEPGVHNWEFWDRNIQRAIEFFKQI
ncbi:MAG: hypothetical protein J6R00_04910 [Lentisphaeria bacterium]|nr:hypothetical protein [Lentisphaeria bacterium]